VVVVVLEQRLDAVDAREVVAVPRGGGPPKLQDLVELLQLSEADRRLNVRPAVVQAHADMVEPAAGLVVATLVAQLWSSRHSSSDDVVTTPPSPVVICLFG
jgi:hypothetical protein